MSSVHIRTKTALPLVVALIASLEDVNGEVQRRRDLADFLKARRGQVVRADLGLPPVGGRRTSGLRREEVAYLSHVSVTWYTWLEQGREIKPSRQVLDAIARTFRLSVAEHTYILALAGYSAPQSEAEQVPAPLPEHVQRLLDALSDFPAYATTPDWHISGWNRTYAALYPNVTTVRPLDRNLLWLVFTDPYLRELIPDWEASSRRLLAEFRAEAGPRLGEPPYSHLIGRLLETGEPFRADWSSRDIEVFTSRERVFRHPVAGYLHVEQHRLAPSDRPDVHVVIYTPVLTTDTAARLRRLTEGNASRPASSG
ncbi:helix-turn-helix transcriptional regulator [Streptomyces sp. NPDC058246]|uniref:helix-turn-helix transcriptional regulator n=1 Tax=Streptomyces sp. NPDC058246 TaxID=3346400 RepID=UPI0036E6DD3F